MKSLQTFKSSFDDMVSEFKEMQYLNERLTRENKELKKQLRLLTVVPEYIPQAKFYDLTELYPKGYSGYIREDFEEEYHSIVREHIRNNKNKYNDGDILFLGSTYETRQEYGFYYVCDYCTDICNGEYVYECISKQRYKLYYNHVLFTISQFIREVLDSDICANEILDPDYIEELKKEGKIDLSIKVD